MQNTNRLTPGRAAMALSSTLLVTAYAGSAMAQAPISTAPTNATQGATPPPTAPATPDAPKPWVAPASFAEWASAIKLTFQGNAGIIVNTNDPRNQTNFGQLFTNKSHCPGSLNKLGL